jgi:hydroxymethylpyrimidine/phosphomethylpyrimidine kinase
MTRKIAMNQPECPVALTIAGSDSGGGAGIQADLLTFAAHGVFGTTALTSLTAQSPDGVTAVEALPPVFVAEQILQVCRYFTVRALKTGMLYSAAVIEAVGDFLATHRQIPAVVDPVMVATSGARLLKADAIAALRGKLLHQAALVTPNLDEVEALLGSRPANPAEMIAAGRRLASQHGTPFLLKGGHLTGSELTDVLITPDGSVRSFVSRRVEGVDTHGGGCTLSAAITANLAKGMAVDHAVEAARAYLFRGLDRSLMVSGRRAINHFP